MTKYIPRPTKKKIKWEQERALKAAIEAGIKANAEREAARAAETAEEPKEEPRKNIIEDFKTIKAKEEVRAARIARDKAKNQTKPSVTTDKTTVPTNAGLVTPQTSIPELLALAKKPEPPEFKLPHTGKGFSLFYNIMYSRRGFFLPRHLVPLSAALADKRITKLLCIVGPGSGKSVMISITYPAFTLGIDPSTTILGISAGENLMQGFVTAVGDWIEHAHDWKTLFPDVIPDKDKGWSTERGLYVKGHPPGDPDASYFATGLTSKALTGKHARLIIGDDLHDKENSSSVEACLRVREIFYRQIMGRADPRGARFIIAGRRWHQEDLYGHLKSTGEWVVMELPSFRDDKGNNGRDLYWDITIPDGLICCFNDPAQLENPEPDIDMEAALQYLAHRSAVVAKEEAAAQR